MVSFKKNTGKEIIIEAARQAFSKYGYKKTTLDDIGSLIKKRKTIIYYYFENKDEIFKEVINSEAEKLKGALEMAINNESNPVEKLKTYVFTRMSFLENLGNYYSALKHELLEHLQLINENRKEIDAAEFIIVSNILKEGVNKAIFSVDNINETTQIFITTLKSLEIPFFVREDKYDYQSSLMQLLNMLLYGIIRKYNTA